MYRDQDNGPQGETVLNQTISTLEGMKLAKGRAYAQSAADKVSSCGISGTVSHSTYLQQKSSIPRPPDVNASADTISTSWLYVTKSEAAFRRKHSHR